MHRDGLTSSGMISIPSFLKSRHLIQKSWGTN